MIPPSEIGLTRSSPNPYFEWEPIRVRPAFRGFDRPITGVLDDLAVIDRSGVKALIALDDAFLAMSKTTAFYRLPPPRHVDSGRPRILATQDEWRDELESVLVGIDESRIVEAIEVDYPSIVEYALRNLKNAGWINQLNRGGLYELVADPRERD